MRKMHIKYQNQHPGWHGCRRKLARREEEPSHKTANDTPVFANLGVGGLGLFALHFWGTVYHWGKFGQEFEAGTQIEPQRNRDVAAYWLSHSASLTSQDHPSSGDNAHSGLEYPTSIIHQENTPIRLTYGLMRQSDWGILSIDDLSS